MDQTLAQLSDTRILLNSVFMPQRKLIKIGHAGKDLKNKTIYINYLKKYGKLELLYLSYTGTCGLFIILCPSWLMLVAVGGA